MNRKLDIVCSIHHTPVPFWAHGEELEIGRCTFCDNDTIQKKTTEQINKDIKDTIFYLKELITVYKNKKWYQFNDKKMLLIRIDKLINKLN